MLNDGRNLWLDLIRGCSALLVCLGHLRNVMFVDYPTIINPNIAIKIFYAVTGFGHQAVMVFFVLSGYFVGGAVLRAGAQFSWKSYLIARLTRLWVVLIPCLVITWAVGLIIGHVEPSALAGINTESWHSGPKLGEYSTSFSTLLANLFFLQTIVSLVFGLNGPLWSLANEFWYYLLFPIILTLVGVLKPISYLSRFAALIILMLILWLLLKDMLNSFLVWMMGVGVYILQPNIKLLNQIAVRVLSLLAIIAFGLALACSKSSVWFVKISTEPDFIVGLSFAFLCLILCNLTFPKTRFPWLAKSSLALSEISYSLYLSHFPIVLLIATSVYQSHKFVPSCLLLSQFVSWSFLLIGIGGGVWWLFESRTALVRSKVSALFNLTFVRIAA